MNQFPLPSRILSGRAFAGQAPLPKTRNLEALARYERPDAVAGCLQCALDRNVGGLMTLGDEQVISALKLLNDRGVHAPAVLPIIPNVLGYVREATEYGLAGAGLRRLGRVGPRGMLRAGWAGAARAPRVLRKDFPTLLSILYEVEMAEFRRFRPPAAFLHHQMTDLALSFDNRVIFEQYALLMRRVFHTEPALATSNFPRLARRIRDWGLDISIIAAPFNREDFLMPGGSEAYRPFLESGRFQLVADRLSPEAPTSEDAVAWALEQDGVIAALIDTDETGALPSEERSRSAATDNR